MKSMAFVVLPGAEVEVGTTTLCRSMSAYVLDEQT